MSRGGTWIHVQGVRVSISRKLHGPWKVNVGGVCVYFDPSRRRAGEVFSGVIAVLREAL